MLAGLVMGPLFLSIISRGKIIFSFLFFRASELSLLFLIFFLVVILALIVICILLLHMKRDLKAFRQLMNQVAKSQPTDLHLQNRLGNREEEKKEAASDLLSEENESSGGKQIDILSTSTSSDPSPDPGTMDEQPRSRADHHSPYPLELEEDLLGLVQSGNVEQAIELFDSIRCTLSDRSLSVFRQISVNIALNLRQLMYDFSENELDPSIAVPDLVVQLEHTRTRDAAFELLLIFIKKLGGIFHKRVQQKKSEIVIQAMDFIETNFSTPLTVNAIAAALFISAPYLYRIMREEVGVSPAHYLTNQRIRHATRQLRHTEKPVTQIGNEAGFETEQSFFRQFKKQMDCTPQQYRNRYTIK